MIHKNVLLGITGSIAAYKSAELIRAYQKAGANVKVVMTQAATKFVTPLTLQALSNHPVHMDMLDYTSEAIMSHINLSRWADFILVAPASADFIADVAVGKASNLLTAVCLISGTPVFIAPAMNKDMFANSQTQKNIYELHQRDFSFIGPDEGVQACGDTGLGRMAEIDNILEQTAGLFADNEFAGLHLLITAGATREPIDSIRFISNSSSGKMGFALAQAAAEQGANVTLVAANVNLPTPDYCTRINVTTALDMQNVVMNKSSEIDILIACAAVADFRPAKTAKVKIKKSEAEHYLELIPNPDILAGFTKNKTDTQMAIGFAAETDDVVEHAYNKLINKSLDLIITNDISNPEFGFNSDNNMVSIIDKEKNISTFVDSKRNIGRFIIYRIIELRKELGIIEKLKKKPEKPIEKPKRSKKKSSAT